MVIQLGLWLNVGEYRGLNTIYVGSYKFSPNTGKYEAEITPYVETFHTVQIESSALKSHVVFVKLL